jgi:hypothetical protein
MIQIEYIYPLDFEDVLQFIPMLTTDNDVKTDGMILHLEITKSKPTKLLHLFIDLKTKEYCFNYKKQKDTDLLYEIGDIVISKLHRFKLNRYDVDFEGLIGYIKGNITAEVTIQERKKGWKLS